MNIYETTKIFNPKSIALIVDEVRRGATWLNRLNISGYKGRVSIVSINNDSSDFLEGFRTVKGKVDLAVYDCLKIRKLKLKNLPGNLKNSTHYSFREIELEVGNKHLDVEIGGGFFNRASGVNFTALNFGDSNTAVIAFQPNPLNIHLQSKIAGMGIPLCSLYTATEVNASALRFISSISKVKKVVLVLSKGLFSPELADLLAKLRNDNTIELVLDVSNELDLANLAVNLKSRIYSNTSEYFAKVALAEAGFEIERPVSIKYAQTGSPLPSITKNTFIQVISLFPRETEEILNSIAKKLTPDSPPFIIFADLTKIDLSYLPANVRSRIVGSEYMSLFKKISGITPFRPSQKQYVFSPEDVDKLEKSKIVKFIKTVAVRNLESAKSRILRLGFPVFLSYDANFPTYVVRDQSDLEKFQTKLQKSVYDKTGREFPEVKISTIPQPVMGRFRDVLLLKKSDDSFTVVENIGSAERLSVNSNLKMLVLGKFELIDKNLPVEVNYAKLAKNLQSLLTSIAQILQKDKQIVIWDLMVLYDYTFEISLKSFEVGEI